MLIDGPLAHLPSGKFNANNAWLTCIGVAHNLWQHQWLQLWRAVHAPPSP